MISQALVYSLADRTSTKVLMQHSMKCSFSCCFCVYGLSSNCSEIPTRRLFQHVFLIHFTSFAGAFLIPYLVFAALVGIPILILEASLGQRVRRGILQSWSAVPAVKGKMYFSVPVRKDCIENFFSLPGLEFPRECALTSLIFEWMTSVLISSMNGVSSDVFHTQHKHTTGKYVWERNWTFQITSREARNALLWIEFSLIDFLFSNTCDFSKRSIQNSNKSLIVTHKGSQKSSTKIWPQFLKKEH